MIPVQIIRCTLQGDDTFHFGSAPGSAIRGALYAALGTMYDTYQRVNRDSMDENPVAWLLRLEDTDSSGGKDVPRPLSVRPPQKDGTDEIAFSLAFYGKAIDTISIVLSAVPMMGKLGVGQTRTHFTLQKVESVDPLTGSTRLIINERGDTISDLPAPLTAAQYEQFASLLDDTRLDVTFRTPTRINHRGNVQRQPHFRPWFQRLLGRIRDISEIYMDDPVWVPFGDLLAIAEKVTTVQDNSHWQKALSGSRRDGEMKPVSGFMGRVVYEGDFRQLLPYLLVGQALQVGQNTIKGAGWYDIAYQWAGIKA